MEVVWKKWPINDGNVELIFVEFDFLQKSFVISPFKEDGRFVVAAAEDMVVSVFKERDSSEGH